MFSVYAGLRIFCLSAPHHFSSIFSFIRHFVVLRVSCPQIFPHVWMNSFPLGRAQHNAQIVPRWGPPLNLFRQKFPFLSVFETVHTCHLLPEHLHSVTADTTIDVSSHSEIKCFIESMTLKRYKKKSKRPWRQVLMAGDPRIWWFRWSLYEGFDADCTQWRRAANDSGYSWFVNLIYECIKKPAQRGGLKKVIILITSRSKNQGKDSICMPMRSVIWTMQWEIWVKQ